MNLRQLETFLHVAEAGSISRAAAEMRVAQPVVSRTLKLLEESLGVRLLDRASRGVRLTESGTKLVTRATELLHNFADLKRELRSQNTEPSGTLRVGMPPSLSRLITARVIPEFLQNYPRVMLSVHEANSSDLCASLQRGEVDLAVISSGEPTHDMSLETFASEPFALIASKTFQSANRTEISLNELTDVPLILVSRPNALRKLIDKKFSERGVSPHVVAEANSLIAVAMVQAGVGATILPWSAAWEAKQADSVCCVPVRGLRMTWAVACQKSNPLTAAGERFFQVLRRKGASAVGSGEWNAVVV